MLTGRGRSSKRKINNYHLLVIKNKINIPIHMVLRQRKNKAKACADWKRGTLEGREKSNKILEFYPRVYTYRTFKRETKLGSIIWWIFRNNPLYKLRKHHEMKLLKRFGSLFNLKINKRLIYHYLVITSIKDFSKGWSIISQTYYSLTFRKRPTKMWRFSGCLREITTRG